MIDFANPGRGELYHLKQDPKELVNLYESNSAAAVDVKERLQNKIMQRLREIQDPLLIELPTEE